MTVQYPNGRVQQAQVIPVPMAMVSVLVTIAVVVGGGLVAWGILQNKVSSIQATCDRIERNISNDHKLLNDLAVRVGALEVKVEKRP